ncbi:hypothetical protein IV203_027393 [Nitzschia inconspicua]|uniref:Uncharacterized protein n=1 Tax=Nitzschia inconspicua TaxID=303405 RepID=A0A9K3PQY0_9STRA|nr:hypothetical protein IV203_001173 [Nitzschia inconspicua]KAG7360198.1 hypothetical protein IV203_035297 [Nitzschia inconspicua]KAG7369647.1 hypothetical protein IV203_027393 [Nitzschia inconspicua]
MTPDPMKAIPAELKAFQDGWEEITDDSQPYEVVMEDDFSQEYSAKRINSKVKGGEGSLVQVVVIQIPVAIRMTHGLVLCAAATPLLGFLHGEHVVRRGVLIDDDFPPWVTVPQRAILKSRAKLYFAHLKLITMPDGTMKPTKPLLLYKHSAQHRYNKQKPGLDMNTELSDKVAFNSKGSFESKYVFRMMDAILVNAWRAHQAVFDIAPWLATLAEPPSLAQVRRKLHCAESIEDYTWKTSMESLAELTSLRRSTFVVTAQQMQSSSSSSRSTRKTTCGRCDVERWRSSSRIRSYSDCALRAFLGCAGGVTATRKRSVQQQFVYVQNMHGVPMQEKDMWFQSKVKSFYI